jgi:trafficking protein particle complex subunit 11
MEAFPEDYIAHNIPLILLSGIGHDEQAVSESTERSRRLLQEGGFTIRTDVPCLTDPASRILLDAFLFFDLTSDGFSGRSASARDSPGVFKIKRVGRVGQTPLQSHLCVTEVF